MSQRIRLYMTVEGQAERNFAQQLLAPHLGAQGVDLFPLVVTTNRKLNKRGGMSGYSQFAGDVRRRLNQDKANNVRFTTFIDLYALPSDFPGWDEASRQPTVRQRVDILEKSLAESINSWRFIPYVQQHEFESLLYVDLSQLTSRIDHSERGIAALQKEVEGMRPEEINDGETTAPSKRLIRHVPQYARAKVRVGAPAAAAIGLSTLRADCPHFNQWITTLEQLPQTLADEDGSMG